MPQTSNHYRRIQRVQLQIILLNLAVSAAKLVCGLACGLASMTADGIHSLTDGLNNVAGMIGVYFAYRPKDTKHPYGHRKFETMTTLAISALLFFSAGNLLRNAYVRILHPTVPVVDFFGFLVMLFTILVNIVVNVYEKKMGRLLHSDFLLSDASHTLSDVFVSFSVLGTLIAVKFGLIWVDTLVSAAIAVVICIAAVDIVKQGADILCDAAVIDPRQISDIVCEFDEVSSCHAVRSHGREDDAHVDLHITVSFETLCMEEAHRLVHRIENAVRERIPGVADVAIHVDPPTDACQ